MEKTINLEYKIIRTKKIVGGGHDLHGLKEGLHFIIEKRYCESSLKGKSLKIRYKPILDIEKDESSKNFDIKNWFHSSFSDEEYRNPPWTVDFEDSEYKEFKRFVFASGGVFEVEEEFEDRGVGSYLLDSLLIWAKHQSSLGKVEICIGGRGSGWNKKKLKHFYGKRNLKSGVEIKDTNICMEDTKKKIDELDINEAVKLFCKVITSLNQENQTVFESGIRYLKLAGKYESSNIFLKRLSLLSFLVSVLLIIVKIKY